MSPTNASALDRRDYTLAAAPSALGTLSRIFKLAFPFALGAMVTSALNLGKVAMLSRAEDTGALHILSLLQPSFILILAMMEGLAITNQVFSARSRHNWPRRGVLRASRRLSVLAVILLIVVAMTGFVASQYITVDDPSIRTTLDHFPAFVLSMTFFVIFSIYYGALRGQGKVFLGLLPFAALVVIDLFATHTLVTNFGWGFEAVVAGNLLGAAVVLPVIIWLLRREVATGENVPEETFFIRLRQLQIHVGLPVFSSIVVGVVSGSVIFPALSELGRDIASAFFVVLRYRIAFMIPAIAIGSAIAVLVNQAASDEQRTTRFRYLAVGVPVMLILYAVGTAVLPHWNGALNLLIPVDADSLRTATELMFAQLLLTFFFVAGTAMFQVILEQLGRGIHVLVITILAETGTCAAVLWAMHNGANLGIVVQILNGFAIATFALFAVQFLLLLRTIGSRHAI